MVARPRSCLSVLFDIAAWFFAFCYWRSHHRWARYETKGVNCFDTALTCSAQHEAIRFRRLQSAYQMESPNGY
jgi:hypothetical protein